MNIFYCCGGRGWLPTSFGESFLDTETKERGPAGVSPAGGDRQYEGIDYGHHATTFPGGVSPVTSAHRRTRGDASSSMAEDEEQAMEGEALESIFCDQFEEISRSPFHWRVHISPHARGDGETNHGA